MTTLSSDALDAVAGGRGWGRRIGEFVGAGAGAITCGFVGGSAGGMVGGPPGAILLGGVAAVAGGLVGRAYGGEIGDALSGGR